jgi:glycosyltransferase involved in cell wall biosynthesis
VGEPEASFLSEFHGTAGLVAISAHQRLQAPALPWIATVYNAVDVAQLIVVGREEREPYVLCLARICPDKGQHLAVAAAQRLGVRLVLAGKVENSPSARRYFEELVLPWIDGDRIRHIGEVAGVEKALLLARARALLAPAQWDEPFGLSVVEAMASGTPAISTARGAAPELIEHGVTGFLVDDLDGMVAAMQRVSTIDPERCAALTRARFSPAAMAEGYLGAYQHVLSARGAPSTAGFLAPG